MPTLIGTERPAQFIHDIDPTKLPSAVREQATRCPLDARVAADSASRGPASPKG
jgi:hypothetical protein